jgi:hypothetical protein
VSGLRAAIKIHLLHLVGILFPHIIDDARSKPHKKSRLKLKINIRLLRKVFTSCLM